MQSVVSGKVHAKFYERFDLTKHKHHEASLLALNCCYGASHWLVRTREAAQGNRFVTGPEVVATISRPRRVRVVGVESQSAFFSNRVPISEDLITLKRLRQCVLLKFRCCGSNKLLLLG